MIKAIYFDWGHTFATFSPEREGKLNKILEPHGFDWQKFHPVWRQFYILRSLGKIESDSELETLIRRVTQQEIPVRKMIAITIASHLIPKTHIALVGNLKKRYKVGILSNNVQEWVIQVLQNYKIEKLFDAVIVSSKIGARKPNAKIYYTALDKLSVRPAETILVADEVAEDLVGASGLGIKTVWLNTHPEGWWQGDDREVLKIYQPNAIVKNLREVRDAIQKIEGESRAS